MSACPYCDSPDHFDVHPATVQVFIKETKGVYDVVTGETVGGSSTEVEKLVHLDKHPAGPHLSVECKKQYPF